MSKLLLTIDNVPYTISSGDLPLPHVPISQRQKTFLAGDLAEQIAQSGTSLGVHNFWGAKAGARQLRKAILNDKLDVYSP